MIDETVSQRWTVGRVTITSVLEDETTGIPPHLFFPAATEADVARHEWLVPTFANARGRIAMRVQAFVVETGSRRILVDPCVGNFKERPLPFWHMQSWPFMERFAAVGFDAGGIDLVVHTHLHADHVGWDTTLVDGRWVPTFPTARHLYTDAEVAHCRDVENDPGFAGVWGDSVAPIFDAGLADLVAEDADLGEGLRLEATTGHTPGHVSMWIESDGELALITGDFLHHPVQLSEPEWAELGDWDPDRARVTRRQMLTRAAESRALVLGTHFPTQPAGRVVAHGDTWRFQPV